MTNYRRLADKQDRRVAKSTGLKIEINSGACPGRKGDLKGEDILIETKTMSRPQRSMSIKKDWLDKLSDQAFSMGKGYHMLVFSFGDNTDYGIMPLKDIYNLYDTAINGPGDPVSISVFLKGLEDDIVNIYNVYGLAKDEDLSSEALDLKEDILNFIRVIRNLT